MTPTAAPASSTASTLARPTRPANTAGSPKTPLPTMQFTVRAARLHRPIARTSFTLASPDTFSDPVPVTASLYHKIGELLNALPFDRSLALQFDNADRRSRRNHARRQNNGERYCFSTPTTCLRILDRLRMPCVAQRRIFLCVRAT